MFSDEEIFESFQEATELYNDSDFAVDAIQNGGVVSRRAGEGPFMQRVVSRASCRLFSTQRVTEIKRHEAAVRNFLRAAAPSRPQVAARRERAETRNALRNAVLDLHRTRPEMTRKEIAQHVCATEWQVMHWLSGTSYQAPRLTPAEAAHLVKMAKGGISVAEIARRVDRTATFVRRALKLGLQDLAAGAVDISKYENPRKADILKKLQAAGSRANVVAFAKAHGIPVSTLRRWRDTTPTAVST